MRIAQLGALVLAVLGATRDVAVADDAGAVTSDAGAVAGDAGAESPSSIVSTAMIAGGSLALAGGVALIAINEDVYPNTWGQPKYIFSTMPAGMLLTGGGLVGIGFGAYQRWQHAQFGDAEHGRHWTSRPRLKWAGVAALGVGAVSGGVALAFARDNLSTRDAHVQLCGLIDAGTIQCTREQEAAMTAAEDRSFVRFMIAATISSAGLLGGLGLLAFSERMSGAPVVQVTGTDAIIGWTGTF